MHRTTFTGTKRRTRRTSARHRRTRTLEDWLSRHRTAGRGTHCPGGRTCLCGWRHDTRRRSFVYRTRACLWNDHARCRRLRWTCDHRWRGTRSWRRWLRCRRGSHRRCYSSGWRNDCCRRRRYRTRRGWHSHRCSRNRRCCRLLRGYYGRWRGRRHDRWRRRGRLRHRGRRRWPNCRRYNDRARCDGRWRHWTCRRRNRFLLLRDGFQHISGPGDVRQVDLGLDFFFAAQRTRGPGRRRLRFGRAADVGPYFFCFMLLERTGMGLLLRHSDER
jgi:hypothetical protein